MTRFRHKIFFSSSSNRLKFMNCLVWLVKSSLFAWITLIESHIYLFRSISTLKNLLFWPILSCLDQFLQNHIIMFRSIYSLDSISTRTIAYGYFHQHHWILPFFYSVFSFTKSAGANYHSRNSVICICFQPPTSKQGQKAEQVVIIYYSSFCYKFI